VRSLAAAARELTDRRRLLPLFPSHFCCCLLAVEGGELRFFFEDEMFDDERLPRPRLPTTTLQHASIRLIEIGGDVLEEMQRHHEAATSSTTGAAPPTTCSAVLYETFGAALNAAKRL